MEVFSSLLEQLSTVGGIVYIGLEDMVAGQPTTSPEVWSRVLNFMKSKTNYNEIGFNLLRKRHITTDYDFFKNYGLDIFTGEKSHETIQSYHYDTNFGSIDFLTDYSIILTIKDFSIPPNYLTRFIQLVQNSDFIYSYVTRDNVVADFNRIVKSSNFNTIDLSFVVQPRNLKFDDLVYGGLIGGAETDYLVSYKADGERKFLMFTLTGLWILGAPLSCNLVSVPQGDRMKSFFSTYNGLVIDGEWIPQEHQMIRNFDKVRNFYVAFDVVYHDLKGLNNGEIDYWKRWDVLKRLKSHLEDLIAGPNNKEMSTLKPPHFYLLVKSSHKLVDYDIVSWPPTQHFFKLMTWMLQNGETQIARDEILGSESQPFKTDGLIFTPAKVAYGPLNFGVPLKERVLTRRPDVLKWKPVSELTVDLLVKDGKLYARKVEKVAFNLRPGWRIDYRGAKPKNGEVIKFAISDRSLNFKEFTEEADTIGTAINHIKNHTDLKLMYEDGKLYAKVGTDVEFKYPFTLGSIKIEAPTVIEFYFQDEKLIAKKIRFNKKYPNDIDVVYEIERLSGNPITEGTLSGTDFKLVRKYLRRVSSNLVNSLPDGIKLLDVGSGVGANIKEWRAKGLKVTAVEPNLRNSTVLKERIAGLPVAVIEDKFENLEIDQKYDAISFMMSLTFFAPEQLDLLAKKIDQALNVGGQVIILVLDGNALKEEFKPLYRPGLNLDRLVLGPVSIDLNGNHVTIQFPGTILANVEERDLVGRQEENLFILHDLLSRLSNFKVIEIKRAGGELLLPTDGYKYTQLWTSLKLEKINPQAPKMEIVKEIQSKIGREISYGTKRKTEPQRSNKVPVNITKLETKTFGTIYLIEAKNLFDAVLSSFSESYAENPNSEVLEELQNAVINHLVSNIPNIDKVKRDIKSNKYLKPDYLDEAVAALSDYLGLAITVATIEDDQLDISFSTLALLEGTTKTCVIAYVNDKFYTVATLEKKWFKTIFEIDGSSSFERELRFQLESQELI